MVKKGGAWLTIHEARRILSENSDHEIAEAYVRVLVGKGKIASRKKDGRTSEYNRADIERYHVRQNTHKGE